MTSKNSILGHQLLIVVAAGAMYFANLGATGLWDLDEALFSSIARDMTARSDLVVPMFNGGIFYDKPPLMFWLMMGTFKLFGITEFAARLPAVLLAIGTALTTYHVARRLFSPRVGLWAGLAVASNVIFTVSARAATVDMALTFVSTLAMAVFARGAGLGEDTASTRESFKGGVLYVPKSLMSFIAIGALLGTAILAKGPIGFLLPAAALGLFLLVMNSPAPAVESTGLRKLLAMVAATISPRNFLRVTRAMRPEIVLLAAALVALPWFVAIAIKTDGQWLKQFVDKYNIGPFVHPFLGHRGPWYYHFVVVLVGFFPWSIFLGPTIVHAWRAVRERGPQAASYAFVICWIAAYFGFWSVCSTKLPHYVLAAYPALAILTACFLEAWLERAEAAARFVMPTATGIFLTVGVLMLAVLPFAAARFAPGEEVIALIGVTLVAGGGLGVWFLFSQRRLAYLTAIAAGSVLFIVALFGWAALRIDRHQHSRPLMAAIFDDSSAAPQIAGYKYCDASTVYYAGGPVAEIESHEKLAGFLEKSAHPYVITTGDGLIDLESQIPDKWRVVARRPRFLAKGEIVVVAPLSSSRDTPRSEETLARKEGATRE